MSDPLPEAVHIIVGYASRTIGAIRLDTHGQPEFTGDTNALENLWAGVTRQPFYTGLTFPQVLARMTQKMRGPLWASAAAEKHSEKHPVPERQHGP